MTTMTMDRIRTVVDIANGMLASVGAGGREFITADHCSERTPTLILVNADNENEEIARISADSLERMIENDGLVPYVQSVGSAVNAAYAKGMSAGRREAQAEMRKAMGFPS